MHKCLLSVDWDYFIYSKGINWGSYFENTRSIIDLWYKRYIKEKMQGREIERSFVLTPEWDTFWDEIRRRFYLNRDAFAFVSDSHALSYDIAKETGCDTVCSFDYHADLGYGGLESLEFEINCSNWLGMLLKDGQVKEAYIFYSSHTTERPEYFSQINNTYNVNYSSLSDLSKSFTVAAVHICRSGAWTPPWFDEKFNEFVSAMDITYETIDCPPRKWDPVNIDLAQEINYLLA